MSRIAPRSGVVDAEALWDAWTHPRSTFLDNPDLRDQFNSTAGLYQLDVPGPKTWVYRPLARTSWYWATISVEAWIDAGGEPPAGWWERELAEQVARQRMRVRVLRPWWRLRSVAGDMPRRLRNAAAALRGDWERADDW